MPEGRVAVNLDERLHLIPGRAASLSVPKDLMADFGVDYAVSMAVRSTSFRCNLLKPVPPLVV